MLPVNGLRLVSVEISVSADTELSADLILLQEYRVYARVVLEDCLYGFFLVLVYKLAYNDYISDSLVAWDIVASFFLRLENRDIRVQNVFCVRESLVDEDGILIRYLVLYFSDARVLRGKYLQLQ